MNWYKTAQQVNILYHATYRPLLAQILKQGLIAPVFLSQDYYQAESFAEVAQTTDGIDKDITEEWLDDIIVLTINIKNLDMNYFENDPYFRVEEEENKTFIYNKNIPPEYLELV